MRVVVLKRSEDSSPSGRPPHSHSSSISNNCNTNITMDTSQQPVQQTSPWGPRLTVSNGLPPTGKRHSVANALNPTESTNKVAEQQVPHLPPKGRSFARRGSYCGLSQPQSSGGGLCFGQDYTQKAKNTPQTVPVAFGKDHTRKITPIPVAIPQVNGYSVTDSNTDSSGSRVLETGGNKTNHSYIDSSCRNDSTTPQALYTCEPVVASNNENCINGYYNVHNNTRLGTNCDDRQHPSDQ